MEKKERLTPPDVTDVSLLKLPRAQPHYYFGARCDHIC